MFKCKICGKKYTELSALLNHIENKHKEMIPENMTVHQYYYYMKTGKTNGNCVICKKPTTWNENTNKYNRFCDDPKCKEKYREMFKNRMINKYGKVHLLDDPNKQREMLAHRKISGEYKWNNSSIKTQYTGSYELDFLKLMDNFFDWDPEDILMPSPHTYSYNYDGEQKFYIPDVFIPSVDLEIEIKDGGLNPNNHHKIQDVDKVKEKAKDEVLTSQKSFHYIKIYDKNYINLFNFLKKYKEEFDKYGDYDKIPRIFLIKDLTARPDMNAVKESFDYKKDEESSEEILTEDLTGMIATIMALGITHNTDKNLQSIDNLIMFDIEANYGDAEKIKEIIQNMINLSTSQEDLDYVFCVVRETVDYYQHHNGKNKDKYIEWVKKEFRKELKKQKEKIKCKNHNKNREKKYMMYENTVPCALINKYLIEDDDKKLMKLLNEYKKTYKMMKKEKPEITDTIDSDVKKAIKYINDLQKKEEVKNELAKKAKNELKSLLESDDIIFTIISNNDNSKLFTLRDNDSKLYIGDKLYIQRPSDIHSVNCIVSEGNISNDIIDKNIIQYKLKTDKYFDESIILENFINQGLPMYGLFDKNDSKNSFLQELCNKLSLNGTLVKI